MEWWSDTGAFAGSGEHSSEIWRLRGEDSRAIGGPEVGRKRCYSSVIPIRFLA